MKPPGSRPGTAARLEAGLAELQLALPEPARQQLLQYVQLLNRWNRAFNLTSVRDPDQMVTRHLLDSLVALPWLMGERVADIGTGAGLPGIPLAVAAPERHFALLDSNGKKTRFVTQAVAELGLRNVEVVRSRAEQYHPEILFDCVISRAFASVGDLISQSGHLCRRGGRILAMKGVYPVAELDQIPGGFSVTEVAPLGVPGLDSERHMVVVDCAHQPADAGLRKVQ